MENVWRENFHVEKLSAIKAAAIKAACDHFAVEHGESLDRTDITELALIFVFLPLNATLSCLIGLVLHAMMRFLGFAAVRYGWSLCRSVLVQIMNIVHFPTFLLLRMPGPFEGLFLLRKAKAWHIARPLVLRAQN